MIADRLTETVQVLTPTVTLDVYGNQTRAYSTPGVAAAMWIVQTAETEDLIDRTLETATFSAFALPSVALAADSRVVRADGTVLEVIGPPAVARDGRGRPHHQRAVLRITKG